MEQSRERCGRNAGQFHSRPTDWAVNNKPAGQVIAAVHLDVKKYDLKSASSVPVTVKKHRRVEPLKA